MEMPLANQTIYSTNVYYGNGWRRWDSYYRTNRQQETFDENDFGQNTGVARFLNPNGTSDGQFYQVDFNEILTEKTLKMPKRVLKMSKKLITIYWFVLHPQTIYPIDRSRQDASNGIIIGRVLAKN
jgi:hypothetical protein